MKILKNKQKLKVNKMKKIIILIFLFHLFLSCTVEKNIDGDYLSKESQIQISLHKDNFFILDLGHATSRMYNCCDTVSYGKWKKETEGFLSFKSLEKYDTNIVDVSVKEATKGTADSVYIIIDNPIETHYKKFGQKEREVYYTIEVSSNDVYFDSRLASKRWETDAITFFKPKNVVIQKIVIVINPKSEISLKTIEANFISSFPYFVNNNKSNNFTFNMPDLSYQYIAFKRLNNTYVKFNDDSLIWENVKYLKKK